MKENQTRAARTPTRTQAIERPASISAPVNKLKRRNKELTPPKTNRVRRGRS